MNEDLYSARPKRRIRPLRIFLWMVGGFIVLVLLSNVLFSDLDLSSEDRIALIRVEGAILDAQGTVDDLKEFANTPTVKAIVLRIDSPGGAVVPGGLPLGT